MEMEVAPPDEAPVGADNAFGYSSDLDIFTLIPRNLGKEKCSIVEFSPMAPITSHSPIEFNIMSNTSRYVDLKEMKLYIRGRIVHHDGSSLEEGERVGLINYPIASIFQQVDLYLQQTLVCSSGNCYAYKSMIDLLLESDRDDQEGFLVEGLFHRDAHDAMEGTHVSATEAKAANTRINPGFSTRAIYSARSKIFEMQGRLHIDLCMQERCLLNALQMTIKLTQNREPFRLMRPAPVEGEQAKEYRFEILNAILKVPLIKVTDAVALGHDAGLLNGPANYPFEKTEIKTYAIPAGEQQAQLDNTFLSRLPKRIVLGLVPSASFTGHYDRNPFNFQHFKLNYMCLVIDGVCVPSRALTPDYENGLYLECYDSIYSIAPDEVRGKTRKAPTITREEYPSGYCLYAFTLDGSAIGDNYVSPQTVGLSRMDIKFSHNLKESVTIVMYATFNAVLWVDRARNVRVDG